MIQTKLMINGALVTGEGTREKVLDAATGNLKRTHLKLGGKAPVIVFDDAEIEAVVAGVAPWANKVETDFTSRNIILSP